MSEPDSRQEENNSLRDSPIPYFIFTRPDMDLWRWLSLTIALIYLLISLFAGGVGGVLQTLQFLVLPMVCIWFGEEMGGYVGTLAPQPITKLTPGFLVRLGGWMLLLSPIWIPIIAGFIHWLG